MPAEEGYPAYLAARLAEFYERAGYVETLNGSPGSVSVIGAVSPPGGDFSEPVTQHTKRFIRCFWALDKALASARHFPSVNWLESYSEYLHDVSGWWQEQVGEDWYAMRAQAMDILSEENRLMQIVKLVGPDALPDEERLDPGNGAAAAGRLFAAEALDAVDAYSTVQKQVRMLKLILHFHRAAQTPRRRRRAGCRHSQPAGRQHVDPHENARHQRGFDQAGRNPKRNRRSDVSIGDKIPMSELLDRGGQEVLGVSRIEGPIIVVEDTGSVGYDEVVEVTDSQGRVRRGRVLEVGENMAVVEIFAGTTGFSIDDTRVRFLGGPLHIPVTEEMLGRVFDGLGTPLDGGPQPLTSHYADINGYPINPTARVYPRDYIKTGISAIDGMNTLVMGQKLPIFSGAGLPHDQLAAQIVRQAALGTRRRVRRRGRQFAIVFAAMGVKHDVADYFRDSFVESGALTRVAMFLNLADDPPVERLVTPRVALTLAEYLAFEKDMNVLVVFTDMTNYCEALRQISNIRGEVPSRKGYPGYLYSDLACLYERAGRIKTSKGSITQLPILTMPNDDITHPVPDLTGYITEGQIVLGRDLNHRDIYPPISVLPSLSRLMKDGIGDGRTRADHSHLSAQLYAAYAHIQEVRSLASVIGEEELSTIDQQYLKFGRAFEQEFINQGLTEDRNIEKTLSIGWRLLSMLPPEELTRLSPDEIKQYYRNDHDPH